MERQAFNAEIFFIKHFFPQFWIRAQGLFLSGNARMNKLSSVFRSNKLYNYAV